MAERVFINLPVDDPERSRAFFLALGYGHDARFTDEQACCVVVSDQIHAMLLKRSYFEQFSGRPSPSPSETGEVIVTLGLADRAAVDRIVAAAIAAGGQEHGEPQDHGWMYLRGVRDLDGHLWEFSHMGELPADWGADKTD